MHIPKTTSSAGDSDDGNEKSDNLKAKIVKAFTPGNSFYKAKSLFVLDTKRAASGTEKAWSKYIENRIVAEKKFHGPRRQDEGDIEVDDDNDEFCTDEMLMLDLMRDNMALVEEDMSLDEGVLQKSFRLLACEPVFSRDELCSSVTALTRIYSPTRPTYIDVHFQYHYQPSDDAVEWHYSLGFKIYELPGVNDYQSSEVKQFERGPFDRGHESNGWRPLAYGFYDDCDEHGRHWRKIENAKFLLRYSDTKDIYEAFWGPLETGEDEDEDAESDRRKNMVDTIRALLAAVGIQYDIAVDEDDRDSSGGPFMLEGLDDKWFARGVRKACGFQLTTDPENKEQEAGETGEGDSWDDDDDYPRVPGSFE